MDFDAIDVEGVNILDPAQLVAFAQDTSRHGRARLAKAVSQFFEEKDLREIEKRLASDILLNLIRQVETDLKEALAERLALRDNIPQELVVYLANDEISIARSILMHSPVLSEIDLLYIISSKGLEHWRTIAVRENISPLVVDRLVETGETGTVLNLLGNERVHLQQGALKKIARAAMVSEDLQAPLLRRPEVSADVAIDLYMVVSDALRREISQKFNVPAHAVEQALDQLVQELSSSAKGSREATPEMRALARKFKERESISPDLMVRTLRRGQIGFFVALFAEKAGFEPPHIVRLIQKDGGKPFVVACRAQGMMKSEFASLFLLSRGIRTGEKIVDQRELAMSLKYFDAIKEIDIVRIMASWRKNPDII